MRNIFAILLAFMIVPLIARADEPHKQTSVAAPAPSTKTPPPLRTLDSYFPFTAVDSPDAWARRAAELRRQTLVAIGLWPLPSRTPLNAIAHTKIERDDYTVEHIILESFPGHFVTGNLYRPKNKTGKLPGILSTHGHWPDGRFQDLGEDGVRKAIADGAERFEAGGRYPLQSRPVQLARMGCIVFAYDMEGYADSIQLPHRPDLREGKSNGENWNFLSPRAELNLQNMMGLQTWNSIRALDFLCSLEGVDTKRLAITGESGGATQTLLLTAVDDRIALAFPAVMVSTAMQGGCTCENAPYLRIDAGNIDLAALAAPRPLGMTAADDWTKEMPAKGFPDLKKLYEMLGRKDDVFLKPLLHFPHNYNSVSRIAMYSFVNKHFKLGLKEPVIDRDYQPLSRPELTVWNADHHKPTGDQVGEAHEHALLRDWAADSRKQIDALLPKYGEPPSEEFRRVVGGAWTTIIGPHHLPDRIDPARLTHEVLTKSEVAGGLVIHGKLSDSAGERPLDTLFIQPKDKWNGDVVIWVTNTGTKEMLTATGDPIEPVQLLLDAGFAVASTDLAGQTDPPLTTVPMAHQGDGKNSWQHAAAYTFGYNRPLFAQRVAEILRLSRFIETDKHAAKRIHVIALGPVAGPLAAAARAVATSHFTKTAIDTAHFRFDSITRIDDPMFLPGGTKYGDVPALLPLGFTAPLWQPGENEKDPVTAAAQWIAK